MERHEAKRKAKLARKLRKAAEQQTDRFFAAMLTRHAINARREARK